MKRAEVDECPSTSSWTSTSSLCYHYRSVKSKEALCYLMKIILSLKGFDASSGGVPSPIFLPHLELCSIPIPEHSAYGRTRYRDIRIGNHTLGTSVHDLTHGHITA